MPRTTRERIDHATPVALDQTQRVTPTVAARPVDFTYQTGAGDLGVLSDALQSLNPKVQGAVQDVITRKQKESMTKGAAARQAMGDMDAAAAAGAIPKEAGPSFQRGYMQMSGQLAAQRYARELQDAYNDPNQFDREAGDVNAFIQEFAKKNRGDVNDPEFLQGFLPEAVRAESALLGNHQQAKTEETRTAVQTGQLELIALKASRGALDILDLEDIRLRGRQLNLNNQEIDALAFEAISQEALKGKPEQLAVFFQKRVDGTPGLASNPKYKDKIEAVLRRAEDEQKRVKAEKDQLFLYQSTNQVLADAKRTFTDPDPIIQKYIKDGKWTASHGISVRNEALKAIEHEKEMTRLETAMRNKDSGGVATGKKKDVEEAAQRMFVKTMAEHPDDPQTAIAKVVDSYSAIGVMPEGMKYTLNNANPHSNPAEFEKAAQMYSFVASTGNRTYLEQHLDQGKSLQYDVYWNGVRYEGLNNKQAMEKAARIGTKETEATIKAITSKPEWDTIRSKIDSELLSSEWNIFSPNRDSAQNIGYVRKVAQDLALQHYGTGESSIAASVEWATERVKATHSVVNGRWLYHGNLPNAAVRDPAFPKAADWAVESYTAARTAAKKPVPQAGYYLSTDLRSRVDGKLGLYNASTHMPEGVRVDPRNALTQYRTKSLPDVHDLQRQRQEERALPEQTDDTLFDW